MSEESKLGLPKCAAEYIDLVAKKVRYRRKVRADVRQELIGHFEEALRKCQSDAERDEAARKLIAEFGDPKMLALLIRRGKKRCRPLWLRAFIRTFQVIGVVLLLITIRTAGLALRTPGHATDFYAKLNTIVRQGHDESQNAMPLLDEATAAMTPMPEWMDERKPDFPLDVNDTELAQLKACIESNTKALELVRRVADMPGRWQTFKAKADPNLSARFISRYPGQVFIITVMESTSGSYLTDIRGLTNLLRWRCVYRSSIGDCPGAIDDAMVIIRMGRLFEGKGLLHDQLVGFAIETVGHNLIAGIAGSGKCDSTILIRVSDDLRRLYHDEAQPISFEIEKLFMDVNIDGSYTDSGYLCISGIPFIWRDWPSTLKGFAFGFPDKAEAQKMVDDYYGMVDEVVRRTPWQQRTQARSTRRLLTESGPFMLQIMGDSLVCTADTSWQLRARRDATLAILAIKRFELEKGSLPESLDQLTASGYLTELPMDPWSDKPLVYRKTDDGYTLYSLGTNFKDDGGKSVDSNGKPARAGVNALDIVFWPVAK